VSSRAPAPEAKKDTIDTVAASHSEPVSEPATHQGTSDEVQVDEDSSNLQDTAKVQIQDEASEEKPDEEVSSGRETPKTSDRGLKQEASFFIGHWKPLLQEQRGSACCKE
jgi:hypothetical protein